MFGVVEARQPERLETPGSTPGIWITPMVQWLRHLFNAEEIPSSILGGGSAYSVNG